MKRSPLVRFGMVTDVHYADHDPDPVSWGKYERRIYRDAKRRLEEAVSLFNSRSLDFAIELGDIKDQGTTKSATEKALDEIETSFTAFRGPCYHVCGNHDFDCLAESEFYSHVRNAGRQMDCGYYSFGVNGVTFVVLDACYESNGRHYACNNPWEDANISAEQLKWLETELARSSAPVVVFCHQRLDPYAEPRHLVKNAASVRSALERSGKVRIVFTGHQHNGGVSSCNGIDYYSMQALVCQEGESAGSYAVVSVYADGSASVLGYRNAISFMSGGMRP